MRQTLPIIQGLIVDIAHKQALRLNWSTGEAEVFDLVKPQTEAAQAARWAILDYCTSNNTRNVYPASAKTSTGAA